MLACAVLFTIVCARDWSSLPERRRRFIAALSLRTPVVWSTVGTVTLGVALWANAHDLDDRMVARSRNFYGMLRVYESRRDESATGQLPRALPRPHLPRAPVGRSRPGTDRDHLLRRRQRSGPRLPCAARPTAAHRDGRPGHRHDRELRTARRHPAGVRDRPLESPARRGRASRSWRIRALPRRSSWETPGFPSSESPRKASTCSRSTPSAATRSPSTC